MIFWYLTFAARKIYTGINFFRDGKELIYLSSIVTVILGSMAGSYV